MSDVFNSPLIPAGLREALRFSPDNVPLLVHAADAVLKVGGLAEAETLFKRALALDAANIEAKTGLAETFSQQGSNGTALVLVESLTKSPAASIRALVLHVRLALKAGEPRLAAQLFGRIREMEPTFSDPTLEQELGNYLPKRPQPVLPPKAMTPPVADEESAGGSGNPFSSGAEDAFGEAQRLPAGDLPDDAAVEMEKPELNFSDVGGMDKVKEEIRMKIILPLKQPELFKAYGKKAGGGILLYGPPGCGKTFMARATAGEVNAGFLAVGINDVLDMWIGQSEKNLHAIFEQARSHRPCVLFFDEVDALGANRTDMLKSGGRQMINQFLSELDGVSSSNEGVLILAATNAPWHLDPAFRRPGRFDRIIFVPPPDAPARAAVTARRRASMRAPFRSPTSR